MTYEFSDENALIIKEVGYAFKTQALLLGLLGLVLISNTILKWNNDSVGAQIFKIISSSFFIVIAVVLYLPSDNFENIDNTEGNDIEELMTGIDELRMAFGVMIILVSLMMIINYLVKVI